MLLKLQISCGDTILILRLPFYVVMFQTELMDAWLINFLSQTRAMGRCWTDKLDG
jgi:hypothetical protein